MQFWSAYIGCDAQHSDAVQLFMEQVDVIKRLAADYPQDMAYVTTAQGRKKYKGRNAPFTRPFFPYVGIEDAMAQGKIASLVGVESGHAIDSSLGVLRMLYDVGARYMTLTHTCNTPW